MPKPEGPVAHRSDYQTATIPHAQALAFVTAAHDAGGAANTSIYAHGLFRSADQALVGVSLWMPPAAGAAKWVSRYTKGLVKPGEVLALSRLVVAEGEPKNATGLFLGGSTRLVVADARFWALLTYADSWQAHEGTVYKATGWTDAGETDPTPVWTRNGVVVSSICAYGRKNGRRLTTTRSPADMVADGCTLEGHFTKRRFVKVLREAP